MSGYSSYQPSNMTWCNTIPAEWKTNRLKVLFSERKESNSPVKTTEILSLTNTRGVIPYAQKGNIGNKSKDNIEAYHLAYPGDLVVNCMNVVIGSVGISKYFGAVSPVYYTLSSKGVNARYYEYIFKLPTFEESIKGLGNGILEIRMRIPMSKLNSIVFPVPSRNEQDQIVKYLDWQTSKINKMIIAEKQEIELIKEIKRNLISMLVLGQNCTDIPMKASNIDGIGNVPDHWSIRAYKRIFSERVEKSETGKELLLSVSRHYGVKPGNELSEDEQYATIKPAESLVGYKIVKKNDLAMNIMRAQNGSYGISDYEGIVSPAYCVYELLPGYSPKYMHYLLKTPQMISIFFAASSGITDHRRRLYADDFLRIKIAVPPLEEQEQIVEQIEKIEATFQGKTAAIEKQIELLKELRTRLISDVVTGQIDVRGVDIPEYEYISDSSDEEESEDDEEVTELEQDE